MEQWKLGLVIGSVALGGVVVGAQVFGAEPASAQRAEYRSCFFAHQEAVDIDDVGVVSTLSRNRTILVPAGYDVVGAGGSSHTRGVVLFCRR